MTAQTADVMVNAVKRQSNSKSNRTVHEWRDRMRFEEMKRYLTDDKQLEQVEEYIQAIEENGDHESMYKLAQMLESVHNKNLDEAVFELYKGASEGGRNSEAMFWLSKCFKTGKGCERSIVKSFSYCYEAVRLGNPEAEYYLSKLFKNHGKELALYWAEHAANQGHAQAAFDTAQMYDSCTGVQRRKGTKNYDTATEYYEKAAALGAPGAGKKITALGKFIRIVKYS